MEPRSAEVKGVRIEMNKSFRIRDIGNGFLGNGEWHMKKKLNMTDNGNGVNGKEKEKKKNFLSTKTTQSWNPDQRK